MLNCKYRILWKRATSSRGHVVMATRGKINRDKKAEWNRDSSFNAAFHSAFIFRFFFYFQMERDVVDTRKLLRFSLRW